MLQGITNGSVKLVERYLPDTYVLVLLLTIVVLFAGVVFEGRGPLQMVAYWGGGLSFSMQMVLVLVTGFVLADTPFFRRRLEALAGLARTPGRAVVLVTLVSLTAAWINWGFGVVIGALFARQVARAVPSVNYSLLIASAGEAVKGATGIIIQFSFYAGIMAMMTQSGLVGSLSGWFADISNPTTFPLFTFLSVGLVNVFVPSGGGQWAVQAPVMLQSGAVLGVDPARAAMAVAWGDAWTNMIQPFWVLPALVIAGLSAKDVMGYCLIVMLASGIVIGLGLMFLP